MPYKQPPVASQFKKGQSGNPAGRPPNIKYVSDFIREKLNVVNPQTGKCPAEEIADTLIAEATAGTPALLLEFMTRTEGKVTDKVDVTSGGKSLADLLLALKQPSGHSN